MFKLNSNGAKVMPHNLTLGGLRKAISMVYTRDCKEEIQSAFLDTIDFDTVDRYTCMAYGMLKYINDTDRYGAHIDITAKDIDRAGAIEVLYSLYANPSIADDLVLGCIPIFSGLRVSISSSRAVAEYAVYCCEEPDSNLINALAQTLKKHYSNRTVKYGTYYIVRLNAQSLSTSIHSKYFGVSELSVAMQNAYEAWR